MSELDADTALERRLRAHYGTRTLAPERLERLLGAERSGTAGAAARDERAAHAFAFSRASERMRSWLRDLPRHVPRAALLATLLLAVAVLMRVDGSVSERTERTLREAAMNHGTRFEPEFRAASVTALDAEMKLLPFALAVPERLGEGVEVIGSRYCSIAGHLAAHVRLRDVASGRRLSLFVAPLAPELARMHGERGDVDGVDVDLWGEGGLFYALARHG